MQFGPGIRPNRQSLRVAVQLNSMQHQYTQRFGRNCLQHALPASISTSFGRATLG